jgi:hypothetical protein
MAAVAEVPAELGDDGQTNQANTGHDNEEKAQAEHACWIYANSKLFVEPLLEPYRTRSSRPQGAKSEPLTNHSLTQFSPGKIVPL